MRSLLLLVPISLVLLGIAIAAFVWAVRRGQFDDMDTPALDILVDDDGRDEGGHLRDARPTPAPPAASPQDRPRAD
ncbi:cbb3-type cytochrome oxidase assembly protein CcoS [Luteimonas sp. gir]|uniref:cbb3-type cytochrome oxidase assembly protein CcoS n=1 Tax=Luteimonas sp. gir TaxID=3127960 RepID=UPI003075B96F